jgi:four helix bundle protein
MRLPASPGIEGSGLRERTLKFAIAVVDFCRRMPSRTEAKVINDQLLRSATSVGANYRAVCRARSRREFIAKLGIVIEEADETLFWLELSSRLRLAEESELGKLANETEELLSIFVVSRATAIRNARSRIK